MSGNLRKIQFSVFSQRELVSSALPQQVRLVVPVVSMYSVYHAYDAHPHALCLRYASCLINAHRLQVGQELYSQSLFNLYKACTKY